MFIHTSVSPTVCNSELFEPRTLARVLQRAEGVHWHGIVDWFARCYGVQKHIRLPDTFRINGFLLRYES